MTVSKRKKCDKGVHENVGNYRGNYRVVLESYVGEENAEEKRKAELRDISVSKSEEQCRSDYSKALIRL